MEKINVISKRLGVSKGKIKDMVNNDEISFELVDGVYYVDENEIRCKLETSTNSENHNSQFDDKFHSYLKTLSKKLVRYYSHTKNGYYLRKSELCKEFLEGNENSYMLGDLYDFVRFQFSYCMREIKKGNTKNNDILENQRLFSYLLKVLENTPNKMKIININPQNDYSY